jgi:hypothetical protein
LSKEEEKKREENTKYITVFGDVQDPEPRLVVLKLETLLDTGIVSSPD